MVVNEEMVADDESSTNEEMVVNEEMVADDESSTNEEMVVNEEMVADNESSINKEMVVNEEMVADDESSNNKGMVVNEEMVADDESSNNEEMVVNEEMVADDESSTNEEVEVGYSPLGGSAKQVRYTRDLWANTVSKNVTHTPMDINEQCCIISNLIIDLCCLHPVAADVNGEMIHAQSGLGSVSRLCWISHL